MVSTEISCAACKHQTRTLPLCEDETSSHVIIEFVLDMGKSEGECEIETILSLFHHVIQEGCKLSLTGCVPARFRKDERSSRVFRENSCRELENYDGRDAPQHG